MAHPAYLREKARELRVKRKLSLLEIAERLALPKTTVFYWIRDLPDPKIKYRDSPARARARAKAARRNVAKHKALRDAAYWRGWNEYPILAQQPTFIDFVCMYIGEGYKRNRNAVSLANSDPRVVRLADHWIRRFARNKVTYSFQYHADQDPELPRQVLELRARRRSEADRGPAQVEQRPALGPQLAQQAWRPECDRERHSAPRPVAGLDGSDAGPMATLDLPRGVAKPGIASAFGAGRSGGSNPATPISSQASTRAPVRVPPRWRRSGHSKRCTTT